jgi:hypothetical protein
MDTLTLKILFMIGVVSSFVIRLPYQRENKHNTIVRDHKTTQEKILLLLVFVGMIILPLIYNFVSLVEFCQLHLANVGKLARRYHFCHCALVVLALSS